MHLLESIEIFFYVDTSGKKVIEYNFHKKDFYLWEQILEIHKENVKNCSLYDVFDEEILGKLENNLEYYSLKLKSEDDNLYRNISLILYIEDINGWNNSKKMLKRNTWNF